MATRSLGTLTVDLVAKTGGFEQGMDRAARTADEKAKKIQKTMDGIHRSVDVFRASVVAIGAVVATATIAWARNFSQSAEEIRNFSRVANAGVEDFQKLAYAAQTVGLSQEKLSDQLKDFSEKTGEYLATGGGGMRDFFENIAPKIGLTAEAFSELSGPQALQKYYDALEDANLNQAQMSFYLENMASDTTALIPLLRNGGAEIKRLGDEAERLGIIMSSTTVNAAIQFQNNVRTLEASLQGLSITIGNQIIPVFADFFTNAQKAANETDGVLDSARNLANDKSISSWLAVTAEGFAVLIDVAVFFGRTISVIFQAFKSVAADIEVAFKTLRANPLSVENWFSDANKRELEVALKERNETVAKFNNDLAELFTYDGARYQRIMLQSIGNANIGRMIGLNDINVPNGPAGSGIGSAAAKAKKEVSEVQKIIDRLKEQYATLGMTATQIERYRIQTAEGTDAQRKQALATLDQIDAWNKAKEAIDKATESSRYYAAIQRELALYENQLDIDVRGVGMGDRQRELLEQENSIRQEYAQRRRELEEAQQVESTRLEKAEYDARVQALSDSEDRKVEILREKSLEKQEAEASWQNGAIRSLQNYVDEVSNVSAQTEQLFTDAFKSAEDTLLNFVKTGKFNFEGFITGIGEDLIRMLIKIGTQMLANAVLGKTLAAATAAASVASGAAIAAAYAPAAALASLASFGANAAPASAGILSTVAVAKASSFAGMFDEGGNIPSGQWGIAGEFGPEIVQGPARVTGRIDTARMLNQSGGGDVIVNIYEDQSRAGQVNQRRGEDGENMIDVFVADIRGGGRASRALEATYGMRRVGA